MRVALCQIEVGDDPKENLDRVLAAIAEAAATPGGCDLAVLPEAAQVRFGNHLAEAAEPLDGPWVTAVREAAREHGVNVVIGVFEPADADRVHNTVVGISSDGGIAGSYRKLHLYDAFGDRESERVVAGDRPVVLDLAGHRLGLVTCYDVRFPELARALVDQGADILVIPAAWAQGVFKEEHWTTLVRARAIENTTWVVAVDKAPDRTPPPRGLPGGVGRSQLVDPMGNVVADLGPFPAVRVLDLDPDLTARVRERLPSLAHRRRDVL
ncbi:carbon-nitrogen hydrolase family protein [Actinomadura logoneensis]|uniref:Carbon-nitrogen hydrolase family protein n=1 Tax=Actinomadura logoneensis TaxID=2293572 RepID=A0A372JJF3_9ACTN|nr:carbon-nitrogen hydrolase family protein [Actinomadura logoneensis]RFU40153.1 carbon-nitrogen hydrolase family protein [Actinomadura logoneensis]